FQARAAAVLAARESHGDGGAGVLRHATGVSRRQAVGRVRTVRVLDDLPVVRDALEAGKVSFANAARLAEASEVAGADAVQADAGLLSDAKSMSDDQFAREARRWAARNRSDRGEADYAHRRARRSLRIWDGDDGMTHLRGELDPMTGERIRNRLEAEARRLRRSDGRDERRTFPQAMADALDSVTATGSDIVQGRGRINRARGGHSPDGSNNVQDRGRTNPARSGRSPGGRADGDAGRRSGNGRDSDADGRRDNGHNDDAAADNLHQGRPIADIAVVSYVDSGTGDLVSQLATGEPLPPSVLERLACNASITGILYDTNGTPLWRGTSKRTATAAQLRALIARDGGCVGCGCHPALCQAHHIRPASQGGPTTIANMVLLCWDCHYKVHHNQWTVVHRHGRFGLLPPSAPAGVRPEPPTLLRTRRPSRDRGVEPPSGGYSFLDNPNSPESVSD
ncbi:MAG: DUF222 domain-containing protein, partial [Gemmatimonadota bacterium]|nr:DUF222 domain-containing protein [Gemmatimonadota bacterium]